MRNRSEYPENWYDEIRPRIIARDGFKCTDCGIRHRQWVATKKGHSRVKIETDEQSDFRAEGWTVYMIRLHVCHLNNDKADIRDENLKSKCVTCHATTDGNYKALIRKGNKVKNQLSLLDAIRIEEQRNTTLLPG